MSEKKGIVNIDGILYCDHTGSELNKWIFQPQSLSYIMFCPDCGKERFFSVSGCFVDKTDNSIERIGRASKDE